MEGVIYQFVCTLWDKFNSVIKITYGHHPWGKECPPCIRKTISGTLLINFFLDISVVCQIVCIFKDKSNGDDDNDANDDDDDEDNDEKIQNKF